MRKFLQIVLISLIVSSCSEYSKLLKSNDYQLMYKKAVEYYNAGDYRRSLNLFEGIRNVFAGTSKAQNIAYYRAFCSYNEKDYTYAAELFKQFVAIYPDSPLAEECQYMIGFCNYKASPRPLLDQQASENAIREFSFFLHRYPNSSRKDDINRYMDELSDKLAYKSYLNAKNYYLREQYKAAVVSLQNSLKDYPGSKHREEILYMLFNSKFQMAANSVEEKQLERFQEAQEEYYYFVSEYPESKYLAELKKRYDEINNYLKNYDYED
ncbi:MAG: outer membrane protein assembly factor BamD [Marinifilaceae bacterium]